MGQEINIILTTTELELLLEFLEDYSNYLGRNGCNDYEFANDPGVSKIISYLGENCSIKNGKILTYDFMVVQYFINKFVEATPISAEFQKTVLREHYDKALDDYKKGLCEEIDNPFSV